MPAKLELPMKKPDVLVKVKGVFKEPWQRYQGKKKKA